MSAAGMSEKKSKQSLKNGKCSRIQNVMQKVKCHAIGKRLTGVLTEMYLSVMVFRLKTLQLRNLIEEKRDAIEELEKMPPVHDLDCLISSPPKVIRFLEELMEQLERDQDYVNQHLFKVLEQIS